MGNSCAKGDSKTTSGPGSPGPHPVFDRPFHPSSPKPELLQADFESLSSTTSLELSLGSSTSINSPDDNRRRLRSRSQSFVVDRKSSVALQSPNNNDRTLSADRRNSTALQSPIGNGSTSPFFLDIETPRRYDSSSDIQLPHTPTDAEVEHRTHSGRANQSTPTPAFNAHKKWHIAQLKICLKCRATMGNCCNKDSASNQSRKKGSQTKEKPVIGREYRAKQQVTLYIPQQDTMSSITCRKGQNFILRNADYDPWWKLGTEHPKSGQEIQGFASKFNFYPKNSLRAEDKYYWFLGNMSREECEELLSRKNNPLGAFLVRFSNNKNQFILSVKGYSEALDKWEVRHYNIRSSFNAHAGITKYFLKEGNPFASIRDLLDHYWSCSLETAPFTLTSVCLLPNPISDPSFLRRWELESKTDVWQIPRSELELGIELGHGFFGTVHKGIWRKQMEVAVKSLRERPGAKWNFEREKEKFIAETEIMKQLNHPNVVKMFGVCIEKFPFFLVQELCENGDLLHHLRKYHFLKIPYELKREKEENVPKFSNLLSWSIQISKGMHYLETKCLVHRDLAARNVLLDRGLRAKVADFGLTFHRDYDKEEAEGEGNKTAIAVYWSAPESIEKREFSHKSDVWAFGVTFWEILTLADRPYNGLPKDKLKERLREDYTFVMEPPKNYFKMNSQIMDNAYHIMKTCWERNPRLRPNFIKVQRSLEKILYQTVNNNRERRKKKKRAWSGDEDSRHKSVVNGRGDDASAIRKIAGTWGNRPEKKLPQSQSAHFTYEKNRTESTTIYDYDINKYEKECLR